LAVIQSIVTRTLRHGSDIDVARELLIGRIHRHVERGHAAQRKPVAGGEVKGLFEARAIPHADRIAVNGPDITVSARAAHRCRCCSSSWRRIPTRAVAGRQAPAHRRQLAGQRRGAEQHLSFRWEEFNTSAATRRPIPISASSARSRRPEALGAPRSVFYRRQLRLELTAPMLTVVRMSERDDRTLRSAATGEGE